MAGWVFTTVARIVCGRWFASIELRMRGDRAEPTLET